MTAFLSNDELQDRLRLVALVRLNITDTAEAPDKQLFSDDQLGSWLDAYAGSVNRATYRALITIALSEVLLGKKIRTQDLSTDGPAVADSLMRLAATYKAEADAEDDAPFFDVVPLFSASAEGVGYRW